ncbi:MAG: porin [Pseudarcicella sp.]|nr:porin [Pseudarcicella sp.]
MRKIAITVFSLLAGFTTMAQDSKSPLSFSGYLDSYYSYNFNNPADNSNGGLTGTARAFDLKSNQFSLGLVQTKAQYATEKTNAVIDLTFGPNAELGQYGSKVGSSVIIKQAYFDWKATDKLTFTAGQFGTHIGYEVIDAPINYHYSLSNLFNNGPFYHVGVKANYAISDKLSIMAGLVNNVDQLNDDNDSPGLIAQVYAKPNDKLSLYLNGIYSNEANGNTTTGKTPDANYALLDLVMNYQATDKFLIGLNAATGSQRGEYQTVSAGDTAKSWGGAALYLKYDFKPTYSIGARIENFDNTNGVRGLGPARVTSITLTPTFTVGNGHLLLKPEFRMDSFNKDFFTDGDGKATKSQITATWAMIYKF